MRFQYPWVLVFLLVPFLFVMFKKTRRETSSIQYSALELFQSVTSKTSDLSDLIMKVLHLGAFSLLIIALARPQLVDAKREFSTQGIQIMMALDISGSMIAEDFKPVNRITVAKNEAAHFIENRPNDQIGLIVFAQQSFTQCPLTIDHDILLELLKQVDIGLIQDGTAIGLGIANSINRLRNTPSKSKVIILLTDGANNAGSIDPLTAAKLAKKYNIKIYTVGIGKDGLVPFPVDDPVFGRRYIQAKVEMNEGLLKEIAALTGGLYFRATDQKSLAEIYRTIDTLEKTKIEVKEYLNQQEIYSFFLWPAIALIFIYLILQNSLFLKIP